MEADFTIYVIGGGYVGLTTAITLAHIGWNVTIVEADVRKYDFLARHESPIHESGASEMLVELKDKISLLSRVPKQLPPHSVVMLAVGTPSGEDGNADLSYLHSAAQEVGNAIPEGGQVHLVIKSTVPIGSNERLKQLVQNSLDLRNCKAEVDVISSPEFLREGSAIYDSLYPSRLVFGVTNDRSREVMSTVFGPIMYQSFESPAHIEANHQFRKPDVFFTTPRNAEAIKYGSNAFLAVKISFINELAMLCEKVGCDVSEVSYGIGLDQRIGRDFLKPGLGWGGSCFPKDTRAMQGMANAHGLSLDIVRASCKVNDDLITWYGEKILAEMKESGTDVIACLGVAFKPGTDDVRDSQSVRLLEYLLSASQARLRVTDPQALEKFRILIEPIWSSEWLSRIELVSDLATTVEGTGMIIVSTEWKQYCEMDLEQLGALMTGKIIVDTRNSVSIDLANKAGFKYVGLGRVS